jgi:hypothetical protein
MLAYTSWGTQTRELRATIVRTVLLVTLLVINLLGELTNFFLGTEPRAILGVPVVIAVLAYLARKRTRSFFRL